MPRRPSRGSSTQNGAVSAPSNAPSSMRALTFSGVELGTTWKGKWLRERKATTSSRSAPRTSIGVRVGLMTSG